MSAKSHGFNKLTSLPLVGSIISAVIASLCCIGPIVLALLGVGGAGLFSKVASLRPYLTGITVIFLGTAFYLAFRKRKVRCEDGTCKIRSPNKIKKIVLMAAAILAVFLFTFPYLLNLSSSNPASDQKKEELSEILIPVEGMTAKIAAAINYFFYIFVTFLFGLCKMAFFTRK